MRIHKTLVTTVALALAATALGACGSTGGASASSGYCKELKADKAYFQSFGDDNPDLTKFDDVLDRLHSLARSAPASTAADWKKLDGMVTTVQQAMDDAGLTFAQLAAMQDGDIPDGVDLDAVAALGPKLAPLSSGEFDDAAAAIDKDARKHCGFALATS